MKNNTNWFWIAMITAGALVSFGLAGPRGGPHGEFGPKGRGHDRLLPPPRVLEQIGLTEAQRNEVGQLKQEHRAALEPLLDQTREMRESLKNELDQEDPGALYVGELVIEGRDLRRRIGETRRTFHESFRALLTPEQLDKWRELRHQRGRRRGSPGEPRGFDEPVF